MNSNSKPKYYLTLAIILLVGGALLVVAINKTETTSNSHSNAWITIDDKYDYQYDLSKLINGNRAGITNAALSITKSSRTGCNIVCAMYLSSLPDDHQQLNESERWLVSGMDLDKMCPDALMP